MEQTYESEVYRSKEGRHILHNLYRKLLTELDVPLAERMVQTRFGDTHVMLYGHPEGRPVLVFYGGYTLNPLAVRPFVRGLDLNRIRLIVPDPVGQIGFSAENRLSCSKGAYGEWACQVMDALGLPVAPVLGYSFGAGVALQLCETSVLRIERLLLVMPSGLAGASTSEASRFMRRAQRKSAPTEEEVQKALQPVWPFPQEEVEVTNAVRMILLHAKQEKQTLGRFSRKSLRKLNAPVCVIAEKSDLLFPGEAVIRRAQKIIPYLKDSRLLSTGGGHGCLFAPEAAEKTDGCFGLMSDFILHVNGEE
ncbi:MAG: alpha/beta hydrolase [Tannerella sp.]|nr:alpha/beta hydrolase [Tannerella sp.]